MMELSWLSAILVGAAFGYFIGSQYPHRFLFTHRRSLSSKDKQDPSLLNDSGNSKKKKNSNPKLKDPLEVEQLAAILDDFKMILVVRNDLKMGKGKIAAQCSHATLGLYKKLLHRAPKALNRWEMSAQPKVVVKIDSEEDMLALQKFIQTQRGSTGKSFRSNPFLGSNKASIPPRFDPPRPQMSLLHDERAKSLKLPTHITIDAGRTQIAPNSRTVMAILGPVEVVDEVTGGLKLL